MKIAQRLLLFFPYLFVFLATLYVPIDPDLGWHLKYGEYFFQHHALLRQNTFSTMMPNFYWADTDWGTDVLTYAVYSLSGFWGLTIVSAGIVTATFYFFAKTAWLSLWEELFLFPLLIYLEIPINNISFRGQQISLLFLGILFYLLSRVEQKRLFLFFIIPLFLIWANVHGEFLLGLAAMVLWIAAKLIVQILQDVRGRNKSIIQTSLAVIFGSHAKSLFIVFVASLLATVINPFGIGLHIDALSHISSPLLKDVAEYLPFPTFSQAWWNDVMVAVLALIGILFLFFTNKLSGKIPFIVVAGVLLLLSFGVKRYAWPAYYMLLPLFAPIPFIVQPDSKKYTTIAATILLILLLAFTLFIKNPLTQFISFNWNTYCQLQVSPCSPNSAKYLQEHHLTNKLFSLYGWGGWLIWQYPQIKPSIDGRMHIWRDVKGYSAFADYYGYEQNMKEIDASSYNVVYISPDKPLYSHMMALAKEGKWKIAYQDNVSGIFVKAD